MNRTFIILTVFIAAIFSGAWALAAEGANITDSSGKVVLEHVDEDSIPKLVELLDDQDYQVWKQAEGLLVSFGDKSVPELLKSAERDRPSLRAIGALGYIKDERAVGPLSRLIDSSDSEVANAAGAALGEIGNPAVKTLVGQLGEQGYRDAAAEILRGITPDEDSIDELRPLLSSDDWATRAWAAYVLGYWKDEGSLDKIKGLLSDKQVEVREKAVVAYRLIAKKYDLDLLLLLSGDQSGLVRREAMAMMARDPSPRVVEPMLKIMESAKDPKDRAAAMAAAGYTKDPRLVEPMIKALDDKDDLVVGEAVYFLGYQDAVGSRKDIISLFKRRHEFKDQMVIQNACEALINFGEPMEPDELHLFLPYLKNGNEYGTKYGVLDLLGKYAGKDDDVTVKALEDFSSTETNQALLTRARAVLERLE
jgi:HEAT repeat protein